MLNSSAKHFTLHAIVKTLLQLLSAVLIAGCASAPTSPPAPVYLYQFAQPKECMLAETGPVSGREKLQFTGKVREINPQVYECAIEIPMAEFKEKLGYCVMRGHTVAAGYEFFKGEQGTRSHSCDARPLVNGNFYFQATGIDQDGCDWLCFPGR